MSEHENLKEYLTFASQLAKDAGKLIKDALDSRMQGSTANVQVKKSNPSDLVTETDKAVEEFIKEKLFSTYPEHKFIGEETFASGVDTEFTNEPTWIVDPIDGTTNFVHGYPFVAVSIGMTLNKVPVIGVIYNPLLDELYSACQGQGAYMNGQRLPLFNPPPTLDDISECLIATEAGSDRSKQVIDAKISAIHEMVRSKADSKTAAQAHSVRTTGSAALNLCSVAKGVVDVYWEVGCWEWDVAAGVVIVTESGGLVLSGSHDKSDFEPVNLFCRKYLAVRAANRKKQEHVVTQMREIIPAIDAPRAPVPGGFDA